MQRLGETEAFKKLMEKLGPELERVRAKYPNGVPPPSNYACKRCKGAGWVSLRYDPSKDPVQQIVPCGCEAGQIEARTKERNAIDSGLGEFEHVTFATHPSQPQQKQAWKEVFGWIAQTSTPFLWLWGEPWTGKTTAAKCIGNAYLIQGRRVIFRKVPSMLNELRGTYEKSNDDSFLAILKAMTDADVLILDDLGKENVTPWVAEQLFTLTDERIEHRRRTVVTTNWNEGELKEKMPRLFPRITDPAHCLTVPFLFAPIRTAGAGLLEF